MNILGETSRTAFDCKETQVDRLYSPPGVEKWVNYCLSSPRPKMMGLLEMLEFTGHSFLRKSLDNWVLIQIWGLS